MRRAKQQGHSGFEWIWQGSQSLGSSAQIFAGNLYGTGSGGYGTWIGFDGSEEQVNPNPNPNPDPNPNPNPNPDPEPEPNPPLTLPLIALTSGGRPAAGSPRDRRRRSWCDPARAPRAWRASRASARASAAWLARAPSCAHTAPG